MFGSSSFGQGMYHGLTLLWAHDTAAASNRSAGDEAMLSLSRHRAVCEQRGLESPAAVASASPSPCHPTFALPPPAIPVPVPVPVTTVLVHSCHGLKARRGVATARVSASCSCQCIWTPAPKHCSQASSNPSGSRGALAGGVACSLPTGSTRFRRRFQEPSAWQQPGGGEGWRGMLSAEAFN